MVISRGETGILPTPLSIYAWLECEEIMPLNLSGKFYLLFTADTIIYGQANKACIQQVVERLLSVEMSAAQPGMLLGKIQSGKNKTFLGVIALSFDSGFDIAVILTKGTKALARQTLERVRRDFARFTVDDKCRSTTS